MTELRAFIDHLSLNRNASAHTVEAYASVGEITRELVAVFGRYREPIRF